MNLRRNGVMGTTRRKAIRDTWHSAPRPRPLAAAALCVLLLLCAGCGAQNAQRAANAGLAAAFEGVTYERVELSTPRKVVLHVVTVDLKAPGIDFIVTPPEPLDGRALRARSTSQFLKEFKAQVAINAGFFEPYSSKGPLSYYPHTGDPVDVIGVAASRGSQYSKPREGYAALAISRDLKASIGGQPQDAYNAVSGNCLLLLKGEKQGYENSPSANQAHPRTAVALDKSGDRLFLFVADGRQAGYSEGLTLPELADLIAARGGYDAVNLDGGGSAALVMEGPGGVPQVLNSPIDMGVAGKERVVGNHLGVYARRRR